VEHEEERGELVQNRGSFDLGWLWESGRNEGEGLLLWEEEGIIGFESCIGFWKIRLQGRIMCTCFFYAMNVS